MDHLKTIDLTNLTINPQLFPNEIIIQSQVGVGIYDGKNKDDRYQDGTLYLTSHRLIYVDQIDPHHHSCFLDVSLIRQTEYWIGFLKSSPKITLLLGPPPHTSSNSQSSQSDSLKLPSMDSDQILKHPAASHWTCHVCGFSNSPGPKCGLCGIPRDLSSTTHFNSSLQPSSSRDCSSTAFQARSLSDIGVGTKDPQPGQFISTTDVATNQSTSITTKEISCPSCTFLNHPSMARCEICDSILGTVQLHKLAFENGPSESNLTANNNQSDMQHSRATTPAPSSSFPSGSYIRLSFRKGGDKSFYFELKKSLQNKSWKIGQSEQQISDFPKINTVACSSSSETHNGNDEYLVKHNSNLSKPTGIDWIIKSIDSQHQAHQAELTESLQDLQALKTKAKEMVQMSQSIMAKMSSLESSTTSRTSRTDINDSKMYSADEHKKASLIGSSLVKLGLPAPAVTQDLLDSDQAFAQELAKELGGLLNRKMNQQHVLTSASQGLNPCSADVGIWPLDEIWCIWNRARGISLVSPGEMIAACQHLPDYTTPKIQLKTFKSGLRVLHTSYFSLEEFESRLIERLICGVENSGTKSQEKEGFLVNNPELDQTNCFTIYKKMSTLEIAQSESLSVNLTTELLQSIELGPLAHHPLQTPFPHSTDSTSHSFRTSSLIARDFNPSTGDTCWFLNLISDFTWVDSNFV